jgi:hypothetical protein
MMIPRQSDPTTSSKITSSLFLGIVVTIGFNLLPIALGFEITMYGCFVLYAGLMVALSFSDRRVLGYATVLSACNPVNNIGYLSFSFLLAVLTILKDAPSLGRVIRELSKRHWWWLFLWSFLLVGLSVPFWPSDLRDMVSVVKHVLSRLGYLALLPLAIGLTIRTPRDGVRAVSLLCLMSVAFLVAFYSRGEAGASSVTAAKGSEAIGLQLYIGNIALSFLRTQVCVLLATLATVGLALGLGIGVRLNATPFYLASAACVFIIMQLASVGSLFSMSCGIVVVGLGYFGVRLSLGRILLGIVLFSIVGAALYLAIFKTENSLSKRIEEKAKQIDKTGIDRFEYWEEGIGEICKSPFGEGWTTRTGHSDWLLFLLSFGWASGLLYVAAAGWLFLSILRSLLFNRTSDRETNILLLVGLAALSVYCINSILDMLSASIGYYGIVWTLILTSATVVAVNDAKTQAKKTTNLGLPQPPIGRQYRRS